MTLRWLIVLVIVAGCGADAPVNQADAGSLGQCGPVLAEAVEGNIDSAGYIFVPGYAVIEPLPAPPTEVSIKQNWATLVVGRLGAANNPACDPAVKLGGLSFFVGGSYDTLTWRPEIEVWVSGSKTGEVATGGASSGSEVGGPACWEWSTYPKALQLSKDGVGFEVRCVNWSSLPIRDSVSIEWGGWVSFDVGVKPTTSTCTRCTTPLPLIPSLCRYAAHMIFYLLQLELFKAVARVMCVIQIPPLPRMVGFFYFLKNGIL